MKYSLQKFPTSPESTLKDENLKTPGKDKQSPVTSSLEDRNDLEFLSPIEVEARKRHERRMRQKKEREQNKDIMFLS
jgi:hypothetical protein